MTKTARSESRAWSFIWVSYTDGRGLKIHFQPCESGEAALVVLRGACKSSMHFLFLETMGNSLYPMCTKGINQMSNRADGYCRAHFLLRLARPLLPRGGWQGTWQGQDGGRGGAVLTSAARAAHVSEFCTQRAAALTESELTCHWRCPPRAAT